MFGIRNRILFPIRKVTLSTIQLDMFAATDNMPLPEQGKFFTTDQEGIYSTVCLGDWQSSYVRLTKRVAKRSIGFSLDLRHIHY